MFDGLLPVLLVCLFVLSFSFTAKTELRRCSSISTNNGIIKIDQRGNSEKQVTGKHKEDPLLPMFFGILKRDEVHLESN